MQNHKQDSFDGGRAPDLNAGPPSEQYLARSSHPGTDEVALLTAILSLTGDSELPWPASPDELAAPSEALPLGAVRPTKPNPPG